MTMTQEKRRARSDIRPTAVRMQLEHVAREGEFELLIVSDDEGFLVGWSVDESGTYSHGGSDGTFAWVDPERNVIGLVFTQTPRGENPVARFQKLVNLAIDEP